MIDARTGQKVAISCGAGYDTVYANRSERVEKTCEHVIRSWMRGEGA